MFGFLIGAACLFGLASVLRHGACHAGGCHGAGWGGRWSHRGHHRGGFFLHAILDRLDTTPGQEKVIRGIVDDLIEQAHEVKREFKSSRNDVARAVRGEQLDENTLRDTFERHDAALQRLREAGVNALSKIHETLDERQRRILGELIESGPFGFGWGPYRGRG